MWNAIKKNVDQMKDGNTIKKISKIKYGIIIKKRDKMKPKRKMLFLFMYNAKHFISGPKSKIGNL